MQRHRAVLLSLDGTVVGRQNLEIDERQGREAQSFTRPVQRQLRRH